MRSSDWSSDVCSSDLFRRRPHRLLVAWREGPERMLDAIAKLGQHGVWHVERVLRDEINADALGTDQSHHALHRFDECLGRAVEQQMRLVEKEHELRLVQIAHLRQFLEQFQKPPQQETHLEARIHHHLVGGKKVETATPVAVGGYQSVSLKRQDQTSTRE